MKRNVIAVLFFLVSLLMASCSKFSNGDVISENRPVGYFRTISMHNNVNVKLVQSDHPRLELTCPENLIDNITTEVIGDTLFIKNENKLNWLRSYDYSINLTVYYDSLSEIKYASIGKLFTAEQDSIRGIYSKQEELVVNGGDTLVNDVYLHLFNLNINEGSGDIDLTLSCSVIKHKFRNGTSCVTLRGKAGYAEHLTRSYGQIHAENLNANIVTVKSESTNDVYVWARVELNAYLYSIGNVYYKGDPRKDQHCFSDGRVIKLD
jgi:hypothetical protein